MVASGGSLGSLVRSLRKARNWSQEELARQAAMEQPQVSQIETGRVLQPSIGVFNRLATALGVPVSDLLRAAGMNEPRPDPDDPLAEIRADTLLMEKLRMVGADNPVALHDLLDNPVIQAYLEKRRRERGGGALDGF